MKKLILLFAISFLINGCSKDDNQTTEIPQETLIQGGDIFLSQVVTINSENLNLEEYNAKLGELNIKALKSDNNEIMFLVPSNFNIGEAIFEITELNLKINYEIKQPILSETVEETIQPFIQNIASIEQEVTNEPESFRKKNVLNAIALFDERMNNASDEEKLRLAEFYQTNKNLIDEIYTTDYTTALAKNYGGLDNSQSFNNFKVSVTKALAFSGLSYLSFSIPSPDLFTKLLALGTAVVAIKAWYDAYDLFYECRSRKIFTVDFQIGNIQSSLSGNNDNFIEYSHNTEQENAMIRLAKEIDDSYSNSTIANVSEFFENLNVLDNIINKINFVINKINQYNPFSEIENIPDAILSNATVTNEDGEDEILNDITYSIDDNNIQIDNIQFQNGVMKAKLSIIDQNAVSGDFIETNLNFEYQDDFNDISGSYPIRVNKEEQIDIVGIWIMNESGNDISCTNGSYWSGGIQIEFFANGTLNWGPGTFAGTYEVIGDNLSLEFNNTVNSNTPCNGAGTNIANTITYTSIYNGVYDGVDFNGTFSHNVDYLIETGNCLDDNCTGSMRLFRQ